MREKERKNSRIWKKRDVCKNISLNVRKKKDERIRNHKEEEEEEEKKIVYKEAKKSKERIKRRSILKVCKK